MPEIDDFLCACLRGEHPAWPSGQDESFAASFLEQAAHHGVLPLLHHVLHPESARNRGWPQEVLEACRQQAIAQTMWELRHQALLGQVLEALNVAGIKPVLFKGVVLAYSLYPSPALRPRADCDLIIAPQDRYKVAEILGANGFVGQAVSCEFLSYEASFSRTEAGAAHTLDLHWRIHYSQLQSRRFPYEELLQHARPLPQLCPAALGVEPVYALLIACLHRANDLRQPQWVDDNASYGTERLIWLYDFHLLIGSMTPQQLSEFTELAEHKGLREICREGLEKARACFSTTLPDTMVAALSSEGPIEPVVRYQHSGMIRQRWLDWLALEGLNNRIAYLFEHVFPPADYMHARFPDAHTKRLPLLYLRRLTDGIWRRIQNRLL